MRASLLILTVLFGTRLAVAAVPSEFAAVIVHQTPEEWTQSLSVSHADRSIDAPASSRLIGKTPSSAFQIRRILIGAPNADDRGAVPTDEQVYSAMNDFRFTVAKLHDENKQGFTYLGPWIQVTASKEREFRVIFREGVPVEALIRTSANTVMRFGLRRKAPKPLE